MANRKPLVISGGRLANIPNGDALDLTGTDTYIVLDERAAPGNPAAGSIALYANAGALVVRDSAGATTTLGAGGGGSELANQIVYGTGGGIDSDADFTYVNTTGALFVNTTTGTAGSVSSATPGTIAMFGVNGSNIDGGSFYFESGSVIGATVDQLIAGTFQYFGGTGGVRSTADTNITNGSAVGGQFVVETGTGGSATITAATAFRAASAGYGGGLHLETGPGSDALITLSAPASFGATATGGNGGTITIRAGDGGLADVVDDTTGVATGGSGGGIILEAGQFGVATADGTATDGLNGTIQFRVAGDLTSVVLDPVQGLMVFHSTNGSIHGITGNSITGTLGVGGELFVSTGNSGTLAGSGGSLIVLGGAAIEAGNGGTIDIVSQTGNGYPNAWGIVAFNDSPAVTPTTPLGISAGNYDFQARIDGVPADPAYTTYTVAATGTDTMQSMVLLMAAAIGGGVVGQAVSNAFKIISSTTGATSEVTLAAGTGAPNPDLFGAIGTSLTATIEYLSHFQSIGTGVSGRGGVIGLRGGEGATKEGAEGGTISVSGGNAGSGYSIASISTTAPDTIVLPGYLVPSFPAGRSITIYIGTNIGSYIVASSSFDGVNTTVVTTGTPALATAADDELIVQDDTIGGSVIIQAGSPQGNGAPGTVQILGAPSAQSVHNTPAPTYIAGDVVISGGTVFATNAEAVGGNVFISGGTSVSVAADYAGGDVEIIGGTATGTETGGIVIVQGGTGGVTNGVGGSVSIVGGDGTGTGDGGRLFIGGGTAGGTGNGGDIILNNHDGAVYQRPPEFAAFGDAQSGMYTLTALTTSGTPTIEMFRDGAARRMVLPTDTTWAFEGRVVARDTVSGDGASYTFQGTIDNNAGTTALLGAVTTTVVNEDDASWDVAVTASDANDALVITVTGDATNDTRWVAFVRTVEVTG